MYNKVKGAKQQIKIKMLCTTYNKVKVNNRLKQKCCIQHTTKLR